ncbi:hypothetical protein CERSUDRAFT_96573 [Gelatoporia subvermispora B]|uniref:Sec20 C-terminal domain-containing protein n=1 Tax=Ceriporiopsis subvermispora (strain B) TaxID=914234 RepID=M2RAL0_CERS8|nr:hypothetical protein CERSUDRAFT_96573 [Gelatoporia subvermispora B]
MPPIPSTLDEQTSALIASLQRRQKDLAEFQIPRLRTCTGPLATQQQFAVELREDLDAFSRQVDSLDLSVDDQRTERNRRELGAIVDELHAALADLKKDARAALLQSKRAIDANQLSNREELLKSSAVREKQDLNEKVAEDALMKANNDVTGALQRTISLMQGELERSVLSTQLLESSTASLKSTLSTHDVLDGLLVTSKHLVTALEKSDWLDRLLILAAFAFFILVVLFILKQRLVDRSLRIAFWWTRFLPSFSGDEALLAAEKGEAVLRSAILTVSSLATSTIPVAVSTALATASDVASSISVSVLHDETPGVTPSSLSISATDSALSDILATTPIHPVEGPEALSQTAESIPGAGSTDSVGHDEL